MRQRLLLLLRRRALVVVVSVVLAVVVATAGAEPVTTAPSRSPSRAPSSSPLAVGLFVLPKLVTGNMGGQAAADDRCASAAPTAFPGSFPIRCDSVKAFLSGGVANLESLAPSSAYMDAIAYGPLGLAMVPRWSKIVYSQGLTGSEPVAIGDQVLWTPDVEAAGFTHDFQWTGTDAGVIAGLPCADTNGVPWNSTSGNGKTGRASKPYTYVVNEKTFITYFGMPWYVYVNASEDVDDGAVLATDADAVDD